MENDKNDLDHAAQQRLAHNQALFIEVSGLLTSLKKKGVDIIDSIADAPKVDGAEQNYLLTDPDIAPIKAEAAAMVKFGLTHKILFGAIRAMELLVDRRFHPLTSITSEKQYDDVVLLLDREKEETRRCDITRKSAISEICRFADIVDRELAEGLLNFMRDVIPHVPHLFEKLEAKVSGDQISFTEAPTTNLSRTQRWQLRQ